MAAPYNYSPAEQFFMLITTGITNFCCVPALITLYRRKMYFEASIGIMTAICSFLYHSIQSVGIEGLFLIEYQWHRLDNIASIQCFLMVIVYLMDTRDPELDIRINFAGLFMVLILQERAPWDIWYTLVPILMFLFMWFIWALVRKTKSKYNKKMLTTGTILFGLGIIGFFKGLQDDQDYLRMWHGAWHLFVGIGSFYIWQSKVPEGEEFTWTNVLTKPVVNVAKYSIIDIEHGA